MRDALLNSIAALTLPPNFLDLIIDQMGGPNMVRDLCANQRPIGWYLGQGSAMQFLQVHSMNRNIARVVCSRCSNFGTETVLNNHQFDSQWL